MDVIKETWPKAFDYATALAAKWRETFFASAESHLWYKRHQDAAHEFMFDELDAHCAALDLEPFAKLVFEREAHWHLVDAVEVMRKEDRPPRILSGR